MPDRVDDPDDPMVAMGRAADLLGVEPAFLRSLDASHVLTPYRSPGGHRRYSRNQLEHAARLRALLDDGHPLDSASYIDQLRTELADARTELAGTRTELADARNELDDTRDRLDESVRRAEHLERRLTRRPPPGGRAGDS